MTAHLSKPRVFLFLQGPHGPFFHHLGVMLRRAGATVWRVGFNAGDQAFWFDKQSYIPFRAPSSDWLATFVELVEQKSVTDLVLYGDVRPIHAKAVAAAKRRGITIHVFEEGYMRPYWVTYERGGTNGNSRLMDTSIFEMRTALAQSNIETSLPPAHWGDMRQHIFYGALYHWFVMFRNSGYANFQPHRNIKTTEEFRLYLKRLLLMPVHKLDRLRATSWIKFGGFPYHLALLQLEHDSSFQHHSPFSSMTEFLDIVIQGFAKGAPRHHHLVIKAHPLEDERAPIQRMIRKAVRMYGVKGRVHFVRGGKLAHLLNDAQSAVTVNSTAAQQVLWRGLPLKIFGKAVFDKPEFVSDQSLPNFFASPTQPDNQAYKEYRRYLLQTSQVPGGFYSIRGRRRLLRRVVDMMLSSKDPYDALDSRTAAPKQQLRLVT